MKYLFLIFTILFLSNQLKSSELEVIELHENKSLDQLVLDQINNNDQDINIEDAEQNEETDNNLEENNKDVSIEENLSNSEEILEKEFINNFFWNDLEIDQLENFLINSKDLKSKIFKNEFMIMLENLDLDYSFERNKEIFYLVANYFYQTGNISEAYNLSKKRDFEIDKNMNFYTSLEINYLLSTFQLDNVCSLKNEYSENIIINNFLLEKLDIFCLVLENKVSEAKLLNSILLESELDIDNNFQNLFSNLIGDDDFNSKELNFNNNKFDDLIFLYSAMSRIAELPLDKNFLAVDPKNLSIPIILNQSTPIDLRLKAANESFRLKNISVDSLAALYQSVDFNSEELSNPDKTKAKLKDDIEISMAYNFQFINIQIFPSERLNALINFWNFAKDNNLQDIAYSLTYKILQSIEVTADSIDYSPQIATSYIFNQDFKNAEKWLDFYDNNKGNDEKSSYARILLALYTSNEVGTLVEVINSNYDKLISINDKKNEELIYTIFNVLNKDQTITLSDDFNSIYDDRLMPSILYL